MVSTESFFAAILKTKLVISTSANNDKQKTELRRTLAFNLQFKQNYKYLWKKITKPELISKQYIIRVIENNQTKSRH